MTSIFLFFWLRGFTTVSLLICLYWWKSWLYFAQFANLQNWREASCTTWQWGTPRSPQRPPSNSIGKVPNLPPSTIRSLRTSAWSSVQIIPLIIVQWKAIHAQQSQAVLSLPLTSIPCYICNWNNTMVCLVGQRGKQFREGIPETRDLASKVHLRKETCEVF